MNQIRFGPNMSSLGLEICNPPAQQYDVFYFVTYGVIMSAMVVVGLVGNLLSIGTFASEKCFQLQLNHFLTAIALVDMVLCLSSFGQWSLWVILNRGHIPLYGYHVYVLHYSHVLACASMTLCIFLSATLTIERFLAIKRPAFMRKYGTKGRTKLIIAVLAITALLVNIPRFFEIEVVQVECQDFYTTALSTVPLLKPTKMRKNYLYFLLYKLISYFVVFNFVPLLILWVLSLKIIFIIRYAMAKLSLRQGDLSLTELSRFNAESTRSSASSRYAGRNVSYSSQTAATDGSLNSSQTYVTKVMLIVCLKFAASYTLPLINDIIELSLFGSQKYRKMVTVDILVVIGNLLVVFNSSCNFFIYFITGPRFRKELARFLSRICAVDGPY